MSSSSSHLNLNLDCQLNLTSGNNFPGANNQNKGKNIGVKNNALT